MTSLRYALRAGPLFALLFLTFAPTPPAYSQSTAADSPQRFKLAQKGKEKEKEKAGKKKKGDTGGSPVLMVPDKPAESDIRLKRDIAEVGLRADGLKLYRYRYLWSETEYVGVMAQDVLDVAPEAVVRGADGFLRVDYGRLGTRLMTWNEWTKSYRAALAGAIR